MVASLNLIVLFALVSLDSVIFRSLTPPTLTTYVLRTCRLLAWEPTTVVNPLRMTRPPLTVLAPLFNLAIPATNGTGALA